MMLKVSQVLAGFLSALSPTSFCAFVVVGGVVSASVISVCCASASEIVVTATVGVVSFR